MMYQVILCLGSNKDAETHIQKAREMIAQQFPDMLFSESLWTSPIDIESPDFLNCIAWGKTEMDYPRLLEQTKKIEKQIGDRKHLRKKGQIVIDIDILMYDGKKYHLSDWEREYVRQLVAQNMKDL